MTEYVPAETVKVDAEMWDPDVAVSTTAFIKFLDEHQIWYALTIVDEEIAVQLSELVVRDQEWLVIHADKTLEKISNRVFFQAYREKSEL